MFRTVQKLLRNEEFHGTPKEIPKRRMKIPHEMYLCKDCGHLYYYKIIKCPLCESRSIQAVNNKAVEEKGVVVKKMASKMPVRLGE